MSKLITFDKSVIFDYYQSGMNCKQIAKLLNINPSTCERYLKSRGVTLNKYKNRRTTNKNLDEHYFDSIDSIEKAYILGFIAADGNVNKPKNENSSMRLTIEINEDDIEVLEKFNINNTISRNKKKKSVYMCVCSDNVCNKLISYGIVQRKSLILKFTPNLREDLVSHYIRGYFDGDGCISINNEKYNRITMIGTFDFLTELANKINIPVYINPIKNVFELRIDKQEFVKKFYDYIYYNHNGYYLQRKYDKFITESF